MRAELFENPPDLFGLLVGLLYALCVRGRCAVERNEIVDEPRSFLELPFEPSTPFIVVKGTVSALLGHGSLRGMWVQTMCQYRPATSWARDDRNHWDSRTDMVTPISPVSLQLERFRRYRLRPSPSLRQFNSPRCRFECFRHAMATVYTHWPCLPESPPTTGTPSTMMPMIPHKL